MIFYAILALAAVRVCGRDLGAALSGGDMVEKGQRMEAEVRIINRSRLPVFCCSCEVRAENLLTGEAKALPLTVTLPPLGETKKNLELTDLYCGKVSFGLARVQVSDPLRLFHSQREVLAEGGASGYFTPLLEGEVIPAEFLDSYNMESYQYSQFEKGSDPGEVFGIREYQEGDSLRQVHWKLTDKLGSMTVKIPSFPIENNILLVLDNLPEPGESLTADQKSRLIERFCSLSGALLEKSIPHSLGWYDTGDEAFCMRRVRSSEELWQVVPEVLACGFREDELSAVYRYLVSREGRNYSNHFLVSAGEGRDAERLEADGAVRVFRTTE